MRFPAFIACLSVAIDFALAGAGLADPTFFGSEWAWFNWLGAFCWVWISGEILFRRFDD